MQQNNKPNDVSAIKPIELLADRLPLSQIDELKKIHEAGQNRDFQLESDLLDKMRRSISCDISDPKNSSSQKESLKTCINAIDLMRSDANLKKDGLNNIPDLKIASDRSIIPPTFESSIADIRSRCLHVSADMANETMHYLSRVEASAKYGAFDQISVYGDQFIQKLRSSHSNNPQPQLGPIAAKVRELNIAANDFHQKINSGMDISSQAEIKGEVISPPPLPNQRPGGLANSQLMQSLKQEVEPQKKSTLGLIF